MIAASPAFGTVLQDALRLPLEDRSRIATRLLESIEEGEDVDVSPEWQEEINRRIAAVRDGTAKLIPHEEVMEEVRQRIAELRRTRSA